MAYIIEVNKRDLSRDAEECFWKNEEGHNAQGTGPECTGDCMSLEGDVREIRDRRPSADQYDADYAEEHGSPVEWAIAYLNNYYPTSSFPDLYVGDYSRGGRRAESEWLSGNETHPYRNEETEYTIYLRGDWSEEQRWEVFEKVGK